MLIKKNNIRKIIRKAHKWLGLILGLQVLFWVAGGVVMSWFPLEMVRGSDKAVEKPVIKLQIEDFIYPVKKVINEYPDSTRIVATYWMQKAVYYLHASSGKIMLDANNGQVISPISEQMARDVALKDFKDSVEILSIEKIDKPAGEVRGSKDELWKVNLQDFRNTSIYVSLQTGKVVARRNDVWRLFDFFWMLHIMDYEERDDFNNLLLQIFAASSLLFIITGLWMLMVSFRKSDFSWLKK